MKKKRWHVFHFEIFIFPLHSVNWIGTFFLDILLWHYLFLTFSMFHWRMTLAVLSKSKAKHFFYIQLRNAYRITKCETSLSLHEKTIANEKFNKISVPISSRAQWWWPKCGAIREQNLTTCHCIPKLICHPIFLCLYCFYPQKKMKISSRLFWFLYNYSKCTGCEGMRCLYWANKRNDICHTSSRGLCSVV